MLQKLPEIVNLIKEKKENGEIIRLLEPTYVDSFIYLVLRTSPRLSLPILCLFNKEFAKYEYH